MKNRIKYLFVLVWALLCSIVSDAQQGSKPYLMNWTDKNGLSDNYVISVTKDHKGYLWVGTANGLNKFDGNEFTNYLYNPKDSSSLSGNVIRGLTVAQDGKVWIATQGGGVSVFNHQNNKFNRLTQKNNSGLSDNRVNYFTETGEGDMMFGYSGISSSKGGLSIVGNDLKIKRHVLRDTLDRNGFPIQASRLLRDTDNITYWFGGRSLNKWNSKTDQYQDFPHHNFSMDISSVSGLINEDDSKLLISFFLGGLWVFNKKTNTYQDQVLKQGVQAMIKNEAGEIWIADQTGIGRLDLATKQVEYILLMRGQQSPFPENTTVVNLHYIDGNLWICTKKGLFCWNAIFQQFNISSIKRPDGSFTYYSDYCGKTHANEWVFLDRQRGLVLTDSTLQVKRILPMPDGKQSFKGLVVKNKNQPFVMIGGSSGLYRWDISDPAIKVYTPKTKLVDTKSLQIWSMYQEGNKLFLGSRYNGLLVIDIETDSLRQYKHDLDDPLSLCHDRYLFEIDEDQNGNLWICTDKGISIMNPQTEEFLEYTNLEKLNNFIIHAVEADQDGNMYIGTRNQGMFKYVFKTKEIVQYTTADGLLYNGVNQLVRDDSLIWGTTRRGINKINTRGNSILGFDQKKGVPINQLYGARMAKLPDQSMYIAHPYSNFYSRFRQNELVQHFSPPQLNISALKVLTSKEKADKIIENGATVHLKADENYFAIDYAAVHFQNAGNIQYEYKLDGYDEDWIKAGKSRTVRYTSLPGGDYQFNLRATDGDGQWSDIQQLSIFLATPWYKTSWFFGLLILCVFLLAFLIYRFRIRQIRKEEHFKQQLAETEMKALRSQINPHFIFNCLNSIKGYIIGNRIEDGTEYVGRFAQLIRMILNHSKEKLIPVSKEIEAMKLYVWLEQERLNQKFEVDYELLFESDPDSLKISPLIFQPYVENAIWHGLMNLDEKGKLKIKIEEKPDQLSILITDNGIGRKAAGAIKQKSIFSKPSLGLELAAKRLEQINQLYKLKSTVVISDLDSTKKNTGTSILINFPIIKSHAHAESNPG